MPPRGRESDQSPGGDASRETLYSFSLRWRMSGENHMEFSYWSRVGGTCRQVEFFTFHRVETSSTVCGIRKVDTTSVVQFEEKDGDVRVMKRFPRWILTED